MEGDRWESPRAQEERARRERMMAFAVLMELVDAGELQREAAFELCRMGARLVQVQIRVPAA